MSSGRCIKFVENAWRKELCSNCFRLLDEHENIEGLTMDNNRSRYQSPAKQQQNHGVKYSNFTENPVKSDNKNNKNNNMTTTITSDESKFEEFSTRKTPTAIRSTFPTSAGSGSTSVNTVKFCGSTSVNNSVKFGQKSSGNLVVTKQKTTMDLTDSSSRKPNFNVGGLITRNSNNNNNTNSSMSSSKKGILKSKEDGNQKRKMNVRFPQEVVKVIGYGGERKEDGSSSCSEDDVDYCPPDPQDSSSIAEILEKNSVSLQEKEFQRLTQKNTNFNSIKTNLQGKTNIEIGPIVGNTGGTSKPLVSIGTFESRNEPLRIQKKIDQDSTDDHNLQNPIPINRKFVPRASVPNISMKSASINPQSASINTKSASASSLPKVSYQNVANFSTSNLSSSASTKSASYSSQSVSASNSTLKSSENAVNFTLNSSSTSAKSASAKSASYSSQSVSASNSTLKSSENPTNLTSASTILPRISPTLPKSASPSTSTLTSTSTSPPKETDKPEIVKSPFFRDKTSSVIVVNSSDLEEKNANKISNIEISGRSSSCAISTIQVNPTLVKNQSEKPALKPKSILKNKSSLSNLIILTEGNNIANKKTSFLSKEVGGATTTKVGGVITIVNTSLIESEKSLEEKDSLENNLKSEIKVDFNEKLSHTPFIIISAKTSSTKNSDSEFDDSLEDSGLDIGSKKVSESDEKSSEGSSSDSGNENDFSDREVKGQGQGGQIPPPPSGLFISVEEEEEEMNKPAKLSPDSVLFSSSTESIPEVCNNKNRGMMPIPNSKRVAPLPPTGQEDSESCAQIYANKVISEEMKESDFDEIYDDVNINLNNKDEEIEEDLESIYDDCSPKEGDEEEGTRMTHGVTGTYNFHDGSRTILDTDGMEIQDEEQVLTRRTDGIEFIGIRKIDSETFLRERSPSPEKDFGGGKRERSSSTSPKTRRKVNQFFSTIGKKAGAAFSNSQLGNYARDHRNKSPFGISPSPTPLGGETSVDHKYKRSMSSDSVSASRTQELYATLTPTSLKFKGLAQKLSKMDLTHLTTEKNKTTTDLDQCESDSSKMFKKNKISKSIKKFLGFGAKEQNIMTESSTSTSTLHNSSNTRAMMISKPYLEEQQITSEEDSSISTTEEDKSSSALPTGSRKPSAPLVPMGRPPPPPPRVHSLDLLNKVGIAGTGGTVNIKPARPPPPVRNNKVAPQFTSVFANSPPGVIVVEGALGALPDVTDMTPPNKPRRKNSVNHSGGVTRDLETSYNHIANLNLETLRLIANQPLTKIQRKSSNISTLSWSSVRICDRLSQSPGFVLYSGQVEGQESTILLQESAPTDPFQFNCLQTDCVFEDFVPSPYVSWQNATTDYSNQGTKALISVLPAVSIFGVEDFLGSSSIPLSQKYLALLQILDFWGSDYDLRDLLVIVQKQTENNYRNNHLIENNTVIFFFQVPYRQNNNMGVGSSQNYSGLVNLSAQDESRANKKIKAVLGGAYGFELANPVSGLPEISTTLVYVHPLSKKSRKMFGNNNSSQDFEVGIKQLLLTSEQNSLLSGTDRQVLLEKVSGESDQVQAQLKLFFQLKLFVPTNKNSEELSKIRKYRSEQAVQQWLDKERALCMKEAIERSISRTLNTEESISPFKKYYLQFLMKPGNSAKAILDMFIELFQ